MDEDPDLSKHNARIKASYILDKIEEQKNRNAFKSETDILSLQEIVDDDIFMHSKILKEKKREKEAKKNQAKTTRQEIKTRAEQRKNFELIQPSYKIVNHMRDNNDVFMASELVKDLSLDIFTVKQCLKFLKKAGVTYHCKAQPRGMRWNKKAKKISHYGLRDNMTPENVTNNVRFIFNLNRTSQGYLNLFQEIGVAEFRLTHAVSSIPDDERVFWLKFLYNAKMHIVEANPHNPNFDQDFIDKGYGDLRMVLKQLKEKFGWN